MNKVENMNYETKNVGIITDAHANCVEELIKINGLQQELETMGYRAKIFESSDNIIESINNGTFSCGLIYNTQLHSSSWNESLLALIEGKGIAYIGMVPDKYTVKMLAERLDISTPAFFAAEPFHHDDFIFQKLKTLRLPLILKSNYKGNSSGIFLCNSYDEAFKQAMRMLNKYHSTVLCEEFIFGQEIAVPIIGNDPENIFFGVTTVNIQRDDSFWLDSDCKMFGDYSYINANIPDGIERKLKEASLKLFRVLECRDFAVFKFRITKDKIYFIGIDPSVVRGGPFDVVGRNGYTFADVLNLIITNAYKKITKERLYEY